VFHVVTAVSIMITYMGEWPKDLTEVTVIALKKKTRATKGSEHRTISLIAHTAKIQGTFLK